MLAEALKTNTSLTLIDLGNYSESSRNNDNSDNKIGDEGAKALAEALKINKTLTEIDLKCGNSSHFL